MPPSSPSPALRRRARTTLGLATLGALGLSVTGAVTSVATAVEIDVDGETHEVRAFGSLTVEDALTRADVALGAADEVTPPLDAALRDGATIEIERAITVDVAIDGGIARRVTAVVDTVGDVLALAEFDHLPDDGAAIDPAMHTRVGDGDRIDIALPIPVVIEVDGETLEVETLASHVETVLEEVGVEVREDDIVSPPEATALFWPTVVTVQRVDIDTEVQEVSLPFDEVRRETRDLRKGTTRLHREGEPGLRRDTYELTLVDGEETERELVDSEVVREPVDRVVLVGTYEPPPPPPRRTTSSSSSSSGSSDSVWDRLARCESGGNWHINTGNGYYGGLQFHPQTWRSVGGTGLPHEHSRETQIEMGKRLQARSGWGQWPACSRRLGLR